MLFFSVSKGRFFAQNGDDTMNLLTPERFMVDDRLMEQDYDRLRTLSPASLQPVYNEIEDVCDRLEYEGSFLYDESPDKTTLLSLTDRIHQHLEAAETSCEKELIQALLLDEVLYRRCRYYRKKKMFE